MIKLYTPKQWYSLFDCPTLIIDDQGLIWAADAYYKVLFGSPSGKIDYAAGKIYGKGLGYNAFEEPIAYLTCKNGVIEIQDAKQGVFSAPILYIKDNKIYTPEEYNSIFDAPSAYFSGNHSGSTNTSGKPGGNSSGRKSSGGGGAGGNFGMILALGLLLALPAILFNITWIGIALSAVYLICAVITVIRYGASITLRNVLKGLVYGFLTLAAVYLFLFVVTTLWSGHNRDVMNSVEGPNELAGWIAGAATFLLNLEKQK